MEAKVDEVAALRIIVLEWQTRPEKRLFHDERTDEPPTFSGSTRLKSSLLLSRMRAPSKVDSDGLGDFGSQTARRFRILSTYLSERRYLYKTLAYIVSSSLFSQPTALRDASNLPAKRLHESRKSVQRAGKRVLEAWNHNRDASASKKTWVMDMVFALGERMDALAGGSQIVVEDTLQDELEAAWSETNLTELVQLLHTSFSVAQASRDLLTSSSVASWFEFMDRHAFFGTFELVRLVSQILAALLTNVDEPDAARCIPVPPPLFGDHVIPGDAKCTKSHGGDRRSVSRWSYGR
jgi:nuclear pore complex protein Nup188